MERQWQELAPRTAVIMTANNIVAHSIKTPEHANHPAVEQALAKFAATTDGLSSAEAAKRLQQYGPNTIVAKTESKWHQLLSYFWGPLPFMIEVAAIISLLRRDWPDFFVVTGLLLYNAIVGFWQDNKAANALAALKKGLAPNARVRRDGKWTTIAAAELVPGDIVKVRITEADEYDLWGTAEANADKAWP